MKSTNGGDSFQVFDDGKKVLSLNLKDLEHVKLFLGAELGLTGLITVIDGDGKLRSDSLLITLPKAVRRT